MIAAQNVAQCKIEHDDCRRTKRHVYAGQNLAQLCSYPTLVPVKDAVKRSMQDWFEEHRYFTSVEWINSYPEMGPKAAIGHFTQMIQDKAYAMGCSIVRNLNCYYIACNYAAGNIVKHLVYETGPVGKKCKKGINSKYPGLCKENEDFTDEKQLFTKDKSEVPLLTKWKKNGKRFAWDVEGKTTVKPTPKPTFKPKPKSKPKPKPKPKPKITPKPKPKNTPKPKPKPKPKATTKTKPKTTPKPKPKQKATTKPKAIPKPKPKTTPKPKPKTTSKPKPKTTTKPKPKPKTTPKPKPKATKKPKPKPKSKPKPKPTVKTTTKPKTTLMPK